MYSEAPKSDFFSSDPYTIPVLEVGRDDGNHPHAVADVRDGIVVAVVVDVIVAAAAVVQSSPRLHSPQLLQKVRL